MRKQAQDFQAGDRFHLFNRDRVVLKVAASRVRVGWVVVTHAPDGCSDAMREIMSVHTSMPEDESFLLLAAPSQEGVR